MASLDFTTHSWASFGCECWHLCHTLCHLLMYTPASYMEWFVSYQSVMVLCASIAQCVPSALCRPVLPFLHFIF